MSAERGAEHLAASTSGRDSSQFAHLHRNVAVRTANAFDNTNPEAGQLHSPRSPRALGNISNSQSLMQMEIPRSSRTMMLALSAACLYGGAAISMNFINKASLHVYPLPNALLLMQMLATLVVLLPLQALGWIHMPPLSWSKAWALLPVTLLYISNVALALVGLLTLNIPMYNTLKRLTPVLVLGAKACMNRRVPALDIMSSVLLIVGGCLVAGMGDFSFDLKGYACALSSVALQASYLLLVEKSGAERGIGVAELLWYNALLSLPFLFLVVLAVGEVQDVVLLASGAIEQMGATSCALLLSANSLLGMFLNYTLFLCTMRNSALTTTIVGVLKGVVATALGFFLLGGVPVHGLNLAGIALNTLGGVWYTTIKYRQRQQRPSLDAQMPSVIMTSTLPKVRVSPSVQLPHSKQTDEPHRLSNVTVNLSETQPLLSAIPQRLHKHDSAQSLEHMVQL